MAVRVTGVFIMGGVLVVACSTDVVRSSPPSAAVGWHSPDTPHTATDNEASVAAGSTQPLIAQSYASALETRGFTALGHCFEADVRFSFPGVEEANGRDAVVRAHELLFGAFSERRVVLRRILRASSAQLLQWTMSGVQTADWFGVSVTGRTAVFDGLAVLATGEDGAVSSLHLVFDVASVKAQLRPGVREPKAASPLSWPSGPPQQIRQSGSSDEMENVAVIRGWLDALDSIDRTAYLACLSDDVEVTAAGGAAPARGKTAAATDFEVMHRQLAELDIRIDAIWGIGDFVGVEYSMSGEQTAPIEWVPLVRDRVVRLQVTDVAELHQARITRVWRYRNLAQADAPGP